MLVLLLILLVLIITVNQLYITGQTGENNRSKITGQTGDGGPKNVEIMVPLKYL